MKIYADQDLSGVEVKLVNEDLWRSFHAVGTEMIITKTGRRMFPSLQLCVSGLDPASHYSLLVEFSLSSPHKYKYKTAWEPVGDAERHLAAPEGRLYRHPQGRALGSVWMGQTHLHLNKIKLANALVDGTILLNSMHKYIPRIHLIKHTQKSSHWQAMPNSTTRAVFAFPHTEFIAVTAYANEKITQLKIANNPFAKGFRSEGNYGKRKLQTKPADENDCKKRRVSEEINVVDLDDEETNEIQEKQHNSPLRLEENANPRARVEDLNESISELNDDDVFETKCSKKLEDNTEELKMENERKPEHQLNVSPKENQQPASSNVIRRLEERVSTRNAKAKTDGQRDALKQRVNRTPNAAIKILNNITNQSPNIEMCNGCRRLRPQYYRPWENTSMCQCKRAESSSERTDNVERTNDANRNSAVENRDKCDSQVNERHETPRNAFNMSRILETVSSSQASLSHLESSASYPQYYTTAVPTYSNLYHNIYSSNQRGLSYFGKIEQPSHFAQPSYSSEKFLSEDEFRRMQHLSDLTVSSSEGDNEESMNVNHLHAKMQIRIPRPLDSRYEAIRNEAISSQCIRNEAINHEDSSAYGPHQRLNERYEIHHEQALRNPVEAFRIHNEPAMRNPADFSDQEEEEQALDFSIRDGEAHRARSPSNYSTVSSSSGYESRNSSSSELQSPPPSPQMKYDRYYSLPNISIVSTLF